MSFESLEDSFIKKANEPIKTDVQSNIDVEKKISTNENDKETYEDKVVKKQVIGGLAALFQEKLQQTKDSDNSNESIFISTENIKYGDKFTDATNYIPDEDVQKYSPIDSYNDSVVEPQITEENSDIDQRHTPNNKYDDTLTFEPSIASEKDILPNSSISKSLNQDAPYSEDEISNKLPTTTSRKKSNFRKIHGVLIIPIIQGPLHRK